MQLLMLLESVIGVENSTLIDDFEELPYSELAGTFMDKFGVLWGFMVEQ